MGGTEQPLFSVIPANAGIHVAVAVVVIPARAGIQLSPLLLFSLLPLFLLSLLPLPLPSSRRKPGSILLLPSPLLEQTRATAKSKWIPAFAGKTSEKGWIPAFAGMTSSSPRGMMSNALRRDDALATCRH